MKRLKLLLALCMLVILPPLQINATDAVQYQTDENLRTEQEQLKELRRQNRRTMRGFTGFLEAGYAFHLAAGTEDFMGDVLGEGEDEKYASKFSLLGSLGYRFNNFFFLGVGTCVEYYHVTHFVSVPVFADARLNLINKKVSPLLGLKLGYGIGKYDGFFCEYSLGVSCRLPEDKGCLNCSLMLPVIANMSNLDAFLYSFGFRVGYEF